MKNLCRSIFTFTSQFIFIALLSFVFITEVSGKSYNPTQVRQVQELLVKLHYKPLSVTGKWNELTHLSLWFYSEDAGLDKNKLFNDKKDFSFAIIQLSKTLADRTNRLEHTEISVASSPPNIMKGAILSFDENWMATHSEKIISIYNFKNGQQVKILNFDCCLESIDFSNDARYLAVTTSGPAIRLWDTKLGVFTYSFVIKQKNDFGTFASPTVIKFRPGSDEIIVADDAGYVNIYNWKTGQRIKKLYRTGYQKSLQFKVRGITSISISQDGKLAAMIGKYDAVFKIWDLENKKQTYSKKLYKSNDGHLAGKIIFNRDGTKVYIYNNFEDDLKIYDIASKKISKFKSAKKNIWDVHYDRTSDALYLLHIQHIKDDDKKEKSIYKYKDGETSELKISSLLNGHTSYNNLIVSQKYNRISFSEEEESDKDFTRIRELLSGKIVGETATRYIPHQVAPCEDSHIISIGIRSSNPDYLVRYDPTEGKFLSSFNIGNAFNHLKDISRYSPNSPQKFLCLPGENKILVAHENSTLTIWDLDKQQLDRVIKSPIKKNDSEYGFKNIVLSTDGSTLVLSHGDGQVNKYGKSEDPSQRAKLFIYDFAKAKYTKKVRLKRLTTKKDLLQAQGARAIMHLSRYNYGALAFLPGSKKFIASRNEWRFGLWNADTGRQIKKYETLLSLKKFTPTLIIGKDLKKSWASPSARTLSKVSSILVSQKGNKILAVLSSFVGHNFVQIFDKSESLPKRSIKIPVGTPDYVALNPDGNLLVTVSSGFIHFINLETEEIASRFIGNSIKAIELSFTIDGTKLILGSDDGSLQIWDPIQKEILAQTYFFSDGEWLTITPEGFFHGSDNAANRVYVRTGPLTTVKIDRFFQALYRPDLVREKLAGDPNQLVAIASEKLNLQKILKGGDPADIVITQLGSTPEIIDGKIEIETTLTDRGGGIGRIEWKVNGITQAIIKSGNPNTEQLLKYRKKLWLEPGGNQIEVIVYNSNNLMASEPAIINVNFEAENTKIEPILHVLAIGINDYLDDALKLKFATDDANAISKAMNDAGGGVYSKVNIKQLLDTEVSAEGIEKAFSEMAGKVRPYDTFILYLAGHGKTLDGRYYFIPQKFKFDGAKSIKDYGISQELWQEWLATITARKSMLIYDTCESGSLTKASEQTRQLERSAAMLRLTRATGRAVMSAATGTEPALEGYKGHGLFTYVLLDAINHSDEDKNGVIDINEIAKFVSKHVPRISKEKFNFEQIPEIKIIGINFPIARKMDVIGISK